MGCVKSGPIFSRFSRFPFLTKMSVEGAFSETEQIQAFKQYLHNYNKLSEVCFNDCIWDFTSRKVSTGENNCALNCAEKFLKMNQRISTRFQEFQMMANENAMSQVTASTKL